MSKIITGIDNSITLIFAVIVFLFIYIFYLVLKSLFKYQSTVERKNVNEVEGDCSICLSQFQNRVTTICNHSFCGDCLMEYYETRIKPSTLRCVMCRGIVTLIYCNFPPNNDLIELENKISRFNVSNSSGFNFYYYYILDINHIVYRGLIEIFHNWIVMTFFAIIFIILIYYLISPYDLIPDNLGIFGYIDDFLLIVAFFIYIGERNFSEFRQQVMNRNINNNNIYS